MTDREPDHWLWRLGALDWIAAGRTELGLAREHVDTRRRALTHARRGAGMALNAVLVAMADRGWDDDACATAWGRSYVDHLRHLARLSEATPEENPLGAEASALATAIMRVPVVPAAGLVQLTAKPGGEVRVVVDQAETLLERCAAFVEPN